MTAEVCQGTGEGQRVLFACARHAVVTAEFDAKHEKYLGRFIVSTILTCVSFRKNWLQVHPVQLELHNSLPLTTQRVE